VQGAQNLAAKGKKYNGGAANIWNTKHTPQKTQKKPRGRNIPTKLAGIPLPHTQSTKLNY